MAVVINDFEVVPASAPAPASANRGSSDASSSESGGGGDGTGEALTPAEVERVSRAIQIRHLRVRAD